MSINQTITTKDPSFWKFLSPDENQRMVRGCLIVGALAFTILGITSIALGHRVLPVLFTSLKHELLIGSPFLTLSIGLSASAFLIPKIMQELKERKVVRYLLKNYRLVDTNIEGKDLKKIICSADAFLFGEIHKSHDRLEKNKTCIENLWNDSSILLSEISADKAIQTYKFEQDKIHRIVCWDRVNSEIREHFQKDLSLIIAVKILLVCKDIYDKKEEVSDERKRLLFLELANEVKILPELSNFEHFLNEFFKIGGDKKNVLLNAFHQWSSAKHSLSKKYEEIRNRSFLLRQDSLAQHVIYFGKKMKVFLIAGMNHLLKEENKKMVPDKEITQKINEQGISYVILYPRKKHLEGDENIFWQIREKKEKVFRDSEIQIANLKEVSGFSSFDNFPREERHKKIINFDKLQIRDNIQLSKLSIDAIVLVKFAIQDLSN